MGLTPPTDAAPLPSRADSSALDRLRRDRLAATVRAAFGADATAAVDHLLRSAQWMKLPGGSCLFREGEPSDSLYLVISGRLVATAGDRGRARILGEIVSGESVGEMGLLTGAPRTASVEATRDSVLVRVSREGFDALVAEHPHVVTGAARLVVRRMAEAQRGWLPAPGARSVAVVPLRDDPRCAAFADQLVAAMQRYVSALEVDRARVDAILAAHGLSPSARYEARNLVVSTWLDEQELTHGIVVHRTSGCSGRWTERCLRHADAVLVVAPADSTAAVRDEERRLFEHAPAALRRELVLIHAAATTSPGGTAAWLQRRDVARHHHVRVGHEGDVARVARFLTGRAVGVAFSGGGARAFAHLGVVRALREAGVPIDAVAGTSQGAVVAANVAMGWDDDTISRNHRAGFAVNPAADYALFPHLALAKGKRLDRALQRCFGDTAIEDTWLPFACVSTDLTGGRAEEHRRGPLWRALRASVAIPGIFPPVLIDGHLHVDGAILDNLPVGALRAMGVGRTIAVDVTVRKELRIDGDELPTAAAFLRERLLRGGTATPGLGAILVKSLMTASLQRGAEAAATADLYLNPEPAEVGLLQWGALGRCAALGYRYAHAELARRDLGALLGAPSAPSS